MFRGHSSESRSRTATCPSPCNGIKQRNRIEINRRSVRQRENTVFKRVAARTFGPVVVNKVSGKRERTYSEGVLVLFPFLSSPMPCSHIDTSSDTRTYTTFNRSHVNAIQ